MKNPTCDAYLSTDCIKKGGYMSVKNNLQQHIPCDAYLSTDCIKRGGYIDPAISKKRGLGLVKTICDSMFLQDLALSYHVRRYLYIPPPTHQRLVYKEHPFEERTQYISNNKLHFLFPIPIFISHFQPMCQESFIPYLH